MVWLVEVQNSVDHTRKVCQDFVTLAKYTMWFYPPALLSAGYDGMLASHIHPTLGTSSLFTLCEHSVNLINIALFLHVCEAKKQFTTYVYRSYKKIFIFYCVLNLVDFKF